MFNDKNYLLSTVLLIILSLISCEEISINKNEKDKYKDELENRIENIFKKKITIPKVVFCDTIFSNAQYTNNKILIGERFFSDDYFTDEDRLSIILHEYIHFINEKTNKFQCLKDSTGKIKQKKTEIFFMKYLSQIELKKDIEKMKKSGFPKEQLIIYEEEAKLPVYMRFIYAPSNLSKDELCCYHIEMFGNKIGLFHHSEFYKELIKSRIDLEKKYFKMRIDYERQNRLNSDGSAKQNSEYYY